MNVSLVDYRLRIITAVEGVRRINDTVRIIEDGCTQGYMQVCMTFHICFLAITSWSPIQISDEPNCC